MSHKISQRNLPRKILQKMLTKKQLSLSFLWSSISGGGFLLVVAFFFSSKITARFDRIEPLTYVKIDGVDYGEFGTISDLESLMRHQTVGDGYTRILLKRDFVTDPSLYEWARRTFELHAGLKDVHLVMKTGEGREVSAFVLKRSKPLSWTVEASDPATGGFHERIELAVQEIAIK